MILKYVSNTMKNFIIITMPLILAFSAILVISSANMHVFAQQANQTATNQTATPTNQTATPTNQTATPTNQTATPTNQTALVSKDLKSKMNEKLLNFTNQAIIAFKSKNKSGEEDVLKTIQEMLINASGKQVVIIPSDALTKSESK